MRIAGVIPDSTLGCYGGQIALEIYPTGCLKACKGCHNPELQAYTYGEKVTVQGLCEIVGKYDGWFDAISFVGGDLLDQKNPEKYVKALYHKFPGRTFYLFTGEEYENVPEWCFKYFHWIKCGPYIEELKQDGFPASSNQKIYWNDRMELWEH